METININMTPNPSDIQTIHCSQGDTEAREWEFELHNNGEVIDAGGITDQIVFKAYEGGTEELLPSSLMNGFVDLGSLTWTYMPNNYFRSSAVISDAKIPSNENTIANIFCSILKQNTANNVYANNEGIAIDGTGKIRIYYDDMPTDATSFAQAMQGVMLWYEKSDSTPVTTPIDADIKYSQGLLTNQEFTYRESPTEEDGLAWIKSIKGQTIKWNQLIQNGNFADTTNWKAENGYSSLSVANNVATVTLNGGSPSPYNPALGPITRPQSIANHKYYVHVEMLSPADGTLYDGGGTVTRNVLHYKPISANVWTTFQGIGNAQAEGNVNEYLGLSNASSVLSLGDSLSYRNYMVIDLTKLFGSTLADSIYNMEQSQSGSGVAYFKSLFPLDYYPYNSGSLIPFMGNGIKTVGKNLLDANIGIPYGNGSGMRWYESQGFMLMANKTYTFSASNTNGASVAVYIIDHATRTTLASSSLVTTYTPTQNVIVYLQAYRGSGIPSETEFQLEIGSQTSYEPYTESVLNLPISTYFPSGMKNIEPNQHTTVEITDELIPTKATTRVGSITIDENTPMNPNGATSEISAFIMPINGKANGRYNIMSDLFEVANGTLYSILGRDANNNVQFALPPSVPQTSAGGQAWFAQHPTTLYFELATPTETSFTTASLVTENGEVALANENGVLVGKCNSDVSADAGFIEGKIKLSDEDGDVYSSKIQIHVERSPQ